MVIGNAVASEGNSFPAKERRAFIFLALTASGEVAFKEAIQFLTEHRWHKIECQKVASLDVEKLSSHNQTVQDAYMTAAEGKPSVIFSTND
jgi:hypothetical protein